MATEAFKPRKIEIIDSTLREGLQSPEWHDRGIEKSGRIYPTLNEKLTIFQELAIYGVSMFEVFSPNVNSRERGDLRGILMMKKGLEEDLKRPILVCAHARLDERDIAPAVEAGVDGINIYIRASDASRQIEEPLTVDGIIKAAYPILSQIKKHYPHLVTRFSAEDAFRTKFSDLTRIYDPLVDLIDRIGIPDTVGTANPSTVKLVVSKLRKRFPKTALNGHFHNDRGLSIINALTAIKAGMQYIDTSILGLGERSGITSMTALLFNLFLENYPGLRDYDLIQSYSLNVLLANIMGIQVPATEPISLTNRTHAAGVHTAARLKKDPAFYEAHNLERFGVTGKSLLLLGPLSGWHVVHYFLKEILGYAEVNEDTAKKITFEFKSKIELLEKMKPLMLLSTIAHNFGLRKAANFVENEPNREFFE